MSNEKLRDCMAQMLHILAEEVAQNKRLANRLAQPWLALMAEALKSEQESKPKKKSLNQGAAFG